MHGAKNTFLTSRIRGGGVYSPSYPPRIHPTCYANGDWQRGNRGLEGEKAGETAELG